MFTIASLRSCAALLLAYPIHCRPRGLVCPFRAFPCRLSGLRLLTGGLFSSSLPSGGLACPCAFLPAGLLAAAVFRLDAACFPFLLLCGGFPSIVFWWVRLFSLPLAAPFPFRLSSSLFGPAAFSGHSRLCVALRCSFPAYAFNAPRFPSTSPVGVFLLAPCSPCDCTTFLLLLLCLMLLAAFPRPRSRVLPFVSGLPLPISLHVTSSFSFLPPHSWCAFALAPFCAPRLVAFRNCLRSCWWMLLSELNWAFGLCGFGWCQHLPFVAIVGCATPFGHGCAPGCTYCAWAFQVAVLRFVVFPRWCPAPFAACWCLLAVAGTIPGGVRD